MDRGALMVAGGSWFAADAGTDPWTVSKTWGKDIFVLPEPANPRARWTLAGALPEPMGNGASAESPLGLVCLGGENGALPTRRAFLLRWEPGGQVSPVSLPEAPVAGAGGAAAVIGRTVYYTPGQSGKELESAVADFWALDLPDGNWRRCASPSGPGRAYASLVAQDNGTEVCLYWFGGRRSKTGTKGVEPLHDLYEYRPTADRWRRRADAPVPMMAAPAVAWNPGRILVLGGDDGAFFDRTAELKSAHPGFPRCAWSYEVRADRWEEVGETPANQVAAVVAAGPGEIYLVSGETKPRHRNPAVWSIVPSTEIQKEAK